MKEYHKIHTVFKRNMETKQKTLLEGVYALPEFEYLQRNEWVFTEKVDGTNIRVIYQDGTLSFAGKTDNTQIPIPLFNKLTDIFTPLIPKLAEMFSADASDVCLYGEGYGEKIQSGGKYCVGNNFVLFDVNINGWWLSRKDVEDIGAKLGIDIVPIIGYGTLTYMVDVTRTGFKSQWGDFEAEGIVARPRIELTARNGNRIITKIKHKDFIQ